MAGGINPSQVFSMISGVGDAVIGGLKDEYQRREAAQLGDLIAKGDLDAASAAALRGGNMELGLKLQELKLSRAAQQTVASGLGNLYTAGGGSGGLAGGNAGGTGTGGQASTGGTSLPTFAQGVIPESVFGKAIAGQESGGRYDIVGPTHPRLGRALGKHQIMEANLPSWSEEAIGRVVSPQEFLSSPPIQEAIFADRFGKLVQKYGNVADAASAWHSGRPLADAQNAKDRLGTRTPDYVRRFMASLPPQWRGGDALSNLQAAAQEARARLGPTGAPQAASLPAEAPLPPTRVAGLGGASTASDAPPAWAPAGMTPQQRADLDAAEARANGGRVPAPAPAPEPSTAPAPTPVAALPSPAPAINAMPGQTGGGPMPAGRPMVLPGQPGAIAPAGSPPTSAASAPAASLPPARVAEVTGAVAAIPRTQDRIPALIRLATTPGLDKGTQALLHDLLKQELESTKLTDVQKNYLMARGQGYTGTLPEFADRMRAPDQIEEGKGIIRRDQQGNITTTVPLPKTGMFPGNDVRSVSLSHFVSTGKLTPDQAANVGAGQTITNPADGSTMFMTPLGLARQMPGEEPVLMVVPPPGSAAPGRPAGAPAPAPAPAPAGPAPGQVAGPTVPGPAAPATGAPAPARGIPPPPPADARPYIVPQDLMTPAGAIRLTPGKPTAGGNENQTAANLFANLSEQAENVITSPGMAKALTVPIDQALWRMPVIGNAVVPDNFRQAKQAELNFTVAWLRRTSGAAIAPHEYVTAENTFFPRPWDDPGTLAQKAQSRRIVIEGLKVAAGPAYHPLSAVATPAGMPPPSAPAAARRFDHLTREELVQEYQRRQGGRR